MRLKTNFQAKICNELIPHVSELKYVGLWYDEHLSWNRHIRESTSRALTRLNNLRKAVRQQWGLSSDVFLQLVHGAILPMMFYGAECWASVLRSETQLRKLDRVLSLAGRMALGLEFTTSYDATLVMAHMRPAQYQILQRLLRFMIRKHRQLLFCPQLEAWRFYASPQGIGGAWFRRNFRQFSQHDLQAFRRKQLNRLVSRGLVAEWQRTWTNTECGQALKALLPTVREQWRAHPSLTRGQATLLARFMTGHCHLGRFSLPWHEEEDMIMCVCRELFSRHHLCFKCP